jgi:hypothetical protein
MTVRSVTRQRGATAETCHFGIWLRSFDSLPILGGPSTANLGLVRVVMPNPLTIVMPL